MSKINLLSIFYKQITVFLIVLSTSISIVHGQNFYTYRSEDVENSTLYTEGNIYQKDFLLFIDLLQSAHPAFVNSNVLPIDSLRNEGYKCLKRCYDENELRFTIQSILSKLHDGHTIVDWNMKNILVYPIVLFFDENDVYLVGTNVEYQEHIGKKISKINKVPIGDVLNAFRPLISYENEYHFLSNVCNYIQMCDLWEFTSLPKKKYLSIEFSDNTALKLPQMSKNSLHMAYVQPQNVSHSPRQKSSKPFSYQIVDNICYLQFDKCQDRISLQSLYGQQTDQNIKKQLESYPIFNDFLTGMFMDIDENEIPLLVVDLRNNPGGNSGLCSQLLSWLMPADSILDYTSYIRMSSFWKEIFPQQEPLHTQDGEICVPSKLYDCSTLDDSEDTITAEVKELFILNTDRSKVYKGDVLFLINSRTYSSAGMLAVLAQDNHIGKIIGTPSVFRPCNYGDLLMWQLPNTNVRGTISHKLFSRPDTNRCQEESLVPDILLKGKWQDVLNGTDIYWEWITNHYMINR